MGFSAVDAIGREDDISFANEREGAFQLGVGWNPSPPNWRVTHAKLLQADG